MKKAQESQIDDGNASQGVANIFIDDYS